MVVAGLVAGEGVITAGETILPPFVAWIGGHLAVIAPSAAVCVSAGVDVLVAGIAVM